MQKKVSIILLFIISLMMIAPMSTEALTIKNDSNDNVLSENILILKKTKKKKKKEIEEVSDLMDDYNQENQDCSGANSLLGDPEDEDSVAWLLQQALNYIKIIGPILVVILSSIDFVQVIVKSDDEAMKKAMKKLITRLILAVLLFFIPTLVEVALDLFGMTSDPTCGLH